MDMHSNVCICIYMSSHVGPYFLTYNIHTFAETWMVRIGKLGLPFVPLALRSQLERTSWSKHFPSSNLLQSGPPCSLTSSLMTAFLPWHRLKLLGLHRWLDPTTTQRSGQLVYACPGVVCTGQDGYHDISWSMCSVWKHVSIFMPVFG